MTKRLTSASAGKYIKPLEDKKAHIRLPARGPESLRGIGFPALEVQVRLGFILRSELLSHVPCIVPGQID